MNKDQTDEKKSVTRMECTMVPECMPQIMIALLVWKISRMKWIWLSILRYHDYASSRGAIFLENEGDLRAKHDELGRLAEKVGNKTDRRIKKVERLEISWAMKRFPLIGQQTQDGQQQQIGIGTIYSCNT